MTASRKSLVTKETVAEKDDEDEKKKRGGEVTPHIIANGKAKGRDTF